MKLKLLSLLIILIACNSQSNQQKANSQEILSVTKMIAVQTDLQLLESFCRVNVGMNESEIKEYFYQAVLKKHLISNPVYDSSLKYYKLDLELYKEILDSVHASIKNMKELDLPGIPKYDSILIAQKDSIHIRMDSVNRSLDSIRRLQQTKHH
jgi:hypothetical protein